MGGRRATSGPGRRVQPPLQLPCAEQFDGSLLSFEGMAADIELAKHQKDGAARIVFGGNSLLWYCVGAGKTYTMAAASQELKRMGLASSRCSLCRSTW